MEARALLPLELTTPCHPNPCNDGEVCAVNRRKCRHLENCRPYVCKSGESRSVTYAEIRTSKSWKIYGKHQTFFHALHIACCEVRKHRPFNT